MIRCLLLLPLFLFVWCASSKAIAVDEDFVLYRKAKFGMSVEQVRQSESQADDISDGKFFPATKDSASGFPVLYCSSNKLYNAPLTEIYYSFAYSPEQPLPVCEGGLFEVMVKVAMPALGESNSVAAHGKFKEMLSEQYGPPEEKDEQTYVWTLVDKKNHSMVWSADYQ